MLFLRPVEREKIPDKIAEVVRILATEGFENMGPGLSQINQGLEIPLVDGVGLNAGRLTWNGMVVGTVVGGRPEKPDWA